MDKEGKWCWGWKLSSATELLELFILSEFFHLSYLSTVNCPLELFILMNCPRGIWGEGMREGMGLWLGDLGTHMEPPEGLSRAQLFQELIPLQTTLQLPRAIPGFQPWMEIWEAEPDKSSNLHQLPHLQSLIMDDD